MIYWNSKKNCYCKAYLKRSLNISDFIQEIVAKKSFVRLEHFQNFLLEGFPWEIWNSENNNQQHNYKVYRLSTSAANRFCICLSTLHISYTLQVPQKRYIYTFKFLVFFENHNEKEIIEHLPMHMVDTDEGDMLFIPA